jgi:hypothetical protein
MKKNGAKKLFLDRSAQLLSGFHRDVTLVRREIARAKSEYLTIDAVCWGASLLF